MWGEIMGGSNSRGGEALVYRYTVQRRRVGVGGLWE